MPTRDPNRPEAPRAAVPPPAPAGNLRQAPGRIQAPPQQQALAPLPEAQQSFRPPVAQRVPDPSQNSGGRAVVGTDNSFFNRKIGSNEILRDIQRESGSKAMFFGGNRGKRDALQGMTNAYQTAAGMENAAGSERGATDRQRMAGQFGLAGARTSGEYEMDRSAMDNQSAERRGDRQGQYQLQDRALDTQGRLAETALSGRNALAVAGEQSRGARDVERTRNQNPRDVATGTLYSTQAQALLEDMKNAPAMRGLEGRNQLLSSMVDLVGKIPMNRVTGQSTAPAETTALLQGIMQLIGFGNGDEVEGRAMGGYIDDVEGFADGGQIPFGGTPDIAALEPAFKQYGQYAATAVANKVTPLSPDKYLNLLMQNRAKMQGAMGMGGAPMGPGGDQPMGFSRGGAIPVGGQQVMDPSMQMDMEGSDSIPAVIDGQRPAALTSGEFVIPAHVVKAKGTEFFEKLISQYESAQG
jgi:hypothetical protein